MVRCLGYRSASRALGMSILIKRVYDAPSSGDGRRILVDRLWPRGLTREGAQIDLWAKEIAPSHDLRRWFGHDARRWVSFQARYETELSNPAVHVILQDICRNAEESTVTLLFAAKDLHRNNAVVLQRWLMTMENGNKV